MVDTSEGAVPAPTKAARGADAGDAQVLVRRTGRLGEIILNRPGAVNALTREMVTAISAVLTDWENNDEVHTVLLTGRGERGLCAGGDIVAIYHDARAGGVGAAGFWADEYALNARIARYPKPYVAIMDGLVLGGGVGVSAHGGIRVVTERSRVGMPETGIGFVPDVGGNYLLSRAPGELGTHLALTAAAMSGADAIAVGMADWYISSGKLPALMEALAHGTAATVIESFAEDAPGPQLMEQRDWIDDCYAYNTAEEIVRALRQSPAKAAREAADAVLAKSPTAVKVTLEALRRARTAASLEDVLDQDYRVSLRLLAGSDFVEGIRAQVIDKDRSPAWSPPALEDVGAAAVEDYFAKLGARELGLGPAYTTGGSNGG